LTSEMQRRLEIALAAGASALSLAGLNIAVLPQQLQELRGITTLNLARNRITDLPAWVADFTELRHLNLAGNQLGSLPDWLPSLEHLETINVTGNRLSNLPVWIGRMANLTELDAARNQIDSLPASIGDLQSLEYLDLSSNKISVLPQSLGDLRCLTDLDLSSNALGQLPEHFQALTRLMHLHLKHNRLKHLSGGIGALEALTRLDLTDNFLVALPPQIGQLPALMRLDLTDNYLVVLPDEIGNLTAMNRLDLANNRLTFLPDRIGDLGNLTNLDLHSNQLEQLPTSIGQLTALEDLNLAANNLTNLPAAVGNLAMLTDLDVSGNRLTYFPPEISDLSRLTYLNAADNSLNAIADDLCRLHNLVGLHLSGNRIRSIPECLAQLSNLEQLDLHDNELRALPLGIGVLDQMSINLSDNPLAPELQAAYDDSPRELKRFLQLLSTDGQFIHEAKLVLVGEGAAGKTCLLGALRGEDWITDRPTTHGIEIKPLEVSVDDVDLTLNGWDFGGQRIYRPTHQLFFSSPAIYLVVWNPRVGPERHFVEYWIDLIRHRAGEDARMLVVATHSGPGERSAHLDEAGIRDRYGDSVAGFCQVDSRVGAGIDELRSSVANIAMTLPYVGRWYPSQWRELRELMAGDEHAYLTYRSYELTAITNGLSTTSAKSLVRISNSLGHWICHSDEPSSSDLVIFKPDWLSTAISFVLDDDETIKANGLLHHGRLPTLWNNTDRPAENRYPAEVYPVFLQLMEKFDISYRLVDRYSQGEPNMSLIAQLVPARRPNLSGWEMYYPEIESRSQVCEIVDSATGAAVEPEGLMYQLIVRFHRFSLGRHDYRASVHWQGGIVLDDGYNGRALVSVDRNKVSVQVRAAYPQFFLHRITQDIQEHISTFWRGLDVQIMLPCLGQECDGLGLFDIAKLTTSRQMGRGDYPCQRCPQWLNIDQLLLGTPAPEASDEGRLVRAVREATIPGIAQVIEAVKSQGQIVLDTIDQQGLEVQRALSQSEERLRNLILALDDEARTGPRLFSIEPLSRTWRRPALTKHTISVTLWCEHSRLPAHTLYGPSSRRGVYQIDVTREWLIKAAPWIRAVSMVMRSLLPVSLAALELDFSDTQWRRLSDDLRLAESSLASVADLGSAVDEAEGIPQAIEAEGGEDELMHVDGSLLRAMHSYLMQTDPSFGGLERVRDRNRYRWIHPRFLSLYQPPPPDIPAKG
jgi:Leucine-rich repeat (LRR) protein